ncbi:MAG: hypothetical protein ACI837_001175 [Crocinitomicaceae bacterium]|jgi:hypothetical protein
MRTSIIFLVFIGITSCSLAGLGDRAFIRECHMDSSVIDKTLGKDESVYVFNFKGIYNDGLKHRIHYSIDGKNKTVNLASSATLKVSATPGKHIFQFYYTSSYHEIYSDSLEIEAQHRAHWSIQFRFSQIIEVSEKPIIYLYPQEPTDVSMTLEIEGDNPFLYPAYTDGWQFVAHPNGDLTFGENTYNYLFWEASNVEPLSVEDSRTGFVVLGNETTSFLEEKLTEAGLTSKEQADFITYWAPRMMQNEQNLVHFIFNEDCERYATLNISPKPDNLYRIYMVWTAINEGYSVEAQSIESIKREGFTVLEWGGQESSIRTTVSQFLTLNK